MAAEPQVWKPGQDVEFHGAEMKAKCNGLYSMQEELVCGKHIYKGGILGDFVLFFGYKQGEKKAERAGWFVAETLVKTGAMVEKYVLFNPSPDAATPEGCDACWHTHSGHWEKAAHCHLYEEPEGEKDCQEKGMAYLAEFAKAAWQDIRKGGTAGEDSDHEGEYNDEESVAAGFTKDLVEKHEHTGEDLPTIVEWGNCGGDPARGVEGAKLSCWQPAPPAAVLWKKIKPHGVQQGMLGDCWFVAALAALAEFPAKIRQIFGNATEKDEHGQYDVTLYHPGRQRFVKVCITDDIPFTQVPGGPGGEMIDFFAGARPYEASDGALELWCPLLEKAFAKFCGSYAATEMGLACWGLVYLCGGQGVNWLHDRERQQWFRVDTVWNGGEQGENEIARKGPETEPESGALLDNEGRMRPEQDKAGAIFSALTSFGKGSFIDAQGLWKKVNSYIVKGFPLGCCIFAQPYEDMKGLPCGHAYTLIACAELDLGEGGPPLQLVKVRNPHGQGEWLGDWSDLSEHWKRYPEIAKKLRQKSLNDGTFWMPWFDFCLYFDSIDLVKVSMPLQGCHLDKLHSIRGW